MQPERLDEHQNNDAPRIDEVKQPYEPPKVESVQLTEEAAEALT